MPYDKFSRFYDLVMDDRSAAARYIAGLIACHNPYAKTVLEIACGTGAILGKLSASYEVTGLDRSKPMLALARKKLPHVHFYREDMTRFRLATPLRRDRLRLRFDQSSAPFRRLGENFPLRPATSQCGRFIYLRRQHPRQVAASRRRPGLGKVVCPGPGDHQSRGRAAQSIYLGRENFRASEAGTLRLDS